MFVFRFGKIVRRGLLKSVPPLVIFLTITACATQTKYSVGDPRIRHSILTPHQCADAFFIANHAIAINADIDRGAYQLRATKDVDRFDTALLERWPQVDGRSRGPLWYVYTRAPKSNNTPHILNYELLGDMYYGGCAAKPQNVAARLWDGKRDGVAVDKQQAARYYEFAALAHVASSQFKLGKMLFEGDGIALDQETGINWLTSAALEGNKESRDYLSGLGITDIPAALSPNSYQKLAQRERQLQQIQSRAMAARQRQTQENWANFALISLAAVGAYYSGSAIAPSAATSQSMNQSTRGVPEKINLRRSRPVFCTSRVHLSVVGEYAPFVNGTIKTFCN